MLKSRLLFLVEILEPKLIIVSVYASEKRRHSSLHKVHCVLNTPSGAKSMFITLSFVPHLYQTNQSYRPVTASTDSISCIFRASK